MVMIAPLSTFRRPLGYSNLIRFSSHCKSPIIRLFSSSNYSINDLVLSNVHEDSGVALVIMNRPPANSLTLEMNEAISASIKQIERNPKVQSVLLASSNPSIFCAGLDVMELISPDFDRLPKFWSSVQQLYLDLYGSRLATIAVIQGHAPAAGCMLAMACDYRIMYGGHEEEIIDGVKRRRHIPSIGLNETQLGIAAPPWMGQLMVRTIGFRPAERALALGTLFPPKEALQVGLVDEVVLEQSFSTLSDTLKSLLPEVMHDQASSPLMQKALKEAVSYTKIPPQARIASKMVTRNAYLQELASTREADIDHFCTFICQDEVQKNLKGYVQALKQKSKAQ